MKCERLGQTRGGVWTPEYRSWQAMKQRCYKTNDISYPNYGGRGITVCRKWRKSFASFLADVGKRPAPGYSIDRLNTNRGYVPGNVVWSTRKVQNRNTRRNKLLTFNGERLTLAEWVERLGLQYDLVKRRLLIGWTVEKALSAAVDSRKTGRPPIVSASTVKTVRRLYVEGRSTKDIAAQCGLSRAYIRALCADSSLRRDAVA